MKLVVAVVVEEDTRDILDALAKIQFRATRISSTGGFLRQGNSTLVIGVDAHQVDAVLGLIANVCAVKVPPANTKRSGATVFVMGVEGEEQV
jgi:ubiquinone/menaquinone biosynthesis C-methylase UbiE